jgi:hypothetical protein
MMFLAAKFRNFFQPVLYPGASRAALAVRFQRQKPQDIFRKTEKS